MTDSTSRSSLQQDSASTAPVLTAAEYIAAVCLRIGIVLSFATNVHGTSLLEMSHGQFHNICAFWLVYNSLYMFLNSASVSIRYVTHRQPLVFLRIWTILLTVISALLEAGDALPIRLWIIPTCAT